VTEEIIITGKAFFTNYVDEMFSVFLERLNDGDIVIRKKLDSDGRSALAGRHTNYGYSGYVIGTIVLKGKSHRIINWRELFEFEQNRYDSQQKSDAAINSAEHAVRLLRGKKIRKVRGGWEIILQ